MIGYEDNENDESSSEKYIDPNDLIMIEDNHNWKPTKNFILGYANQLGFDIENDPPELLNIAEKYLTKQIPDIYQRAFAKGSYRLVYINRITNEIKLKSDLEDDAVEEYEELKEKYLREQKEKQRLANKIKVLPRKKIAPLGGKKVLENPMKEREKEFLKQIEIQYRENEKEKENQDEDIRQLNEKIERDKNKENILYGNNEENEINREENINENKYNNDNYDQNHEINSKEKKFPNKNKFKNHNNMSNLKNNYNTNDNNGDILMLNLNDSNDNKGREYKNIAINRIKNQKKFQDDSFTDKEQNNNDIYINNNSTITNRDKNKNYESDDYNYIPNKNKYNNKNEDDDSYRNNYLNNKNDEEMENNFDNEKAPKILRNNKRRKNLNKDYKFDKETLDKIDNENENDNDNDKNSIFNDNNKSNEYIEEKINIYKKIYKDNNEESENNIDSNKNNNNYLNSLERNSYFEIIKKKFNELKKKYIGNYKREKNNFIKEFNDSYANKKDKDLERYKNKLKEDLSNYENELKNKMNEDIEKYKNELIEEEENNLAYDFDDKNGDFDMNSLELKKINLESQIKKQKISNIEKKENDDKLVRNNENETKKHLEEMNKIKKARLDLQLNNKIKEYSEQIQKDFESYHQKYSINNSKFSGSNINNNKGDLMKEKLAEYSNDLESQLEEKKTLMKEEYEIKLKKEMEDFQNALNLQKSKNPQRPVTDKKDIENDYYSDLNTNQANMKKNNENLEKIINDNINNSSSSFAIIKNKEIKEIDLIMQEIAQKIKETISNQENKDPASLIEDYLSEIITEKKICMSKYNSLVNMTEDDFKNKKFLLQFYIDIIKLITQKLSMNKNNINDDALVNKIISNVNEVINNFKNKYESEKSNKLYPLLYKAFQKIMNALFNDDETNNIIDNSIYGQILNNTNMNMNVTYLNNNTILNDSNINNNLYKSNQGIQTQNLINNSNMNSNPNINNQFFNKNSNRNSISDKRGESNTNQIINQSQTFIYRQNNVNNISSSFSPNRYSNPLNKTFSNLDNANYNLKSIQPINEQTELEVNNTNISVPQLPYEIHNNISPDCKNKYDLIISFLLEESKNILEDLNEYNKQKEKNNKINLLKESVELSQYNKIFDLISKEENSKTNQSLNNINYKKRVFESIKNYCKDIFNFIIKYSTRTKNINIKLNQVIKYIEDYNRNYYGGKNIDYNNNMSALYKKQIENELNNTYNLDIYSNRFYNNINDSFYNTMQSPNYNIKIHNLSYMNKF